MNEAQYELRDKVAQQIWQAYVVEVGRSLPAGLADKLADAAIDTLVAGEVLSAYRDKGRCGACGCDSCEPVR